MGGGAEGVPWLGAVPVAEWIVNSAAILATCQQNIILPLDAPERTVSGGEFGDEVREYEDDDLKGARESIDSVEVEGSEFS